MSEVNKLDDCMVSFDLTIGEEQQKDSIFFGSAKNNDNNEPDYPKSVIGSTILINNKTDIKEVLAFYCIREITESGSPFGFLWHVSSSKDNVKNLMSLFEKDLHIMVDDMPYILNHISEVRAVSTEVTGISEVSIIFSIADYPEGLTGDQQKLGALLAQNVGNTLRFCFNWK
ncbi:DUF7823 domain-containing protein [Xenorhabdus sp. KK7.4]|uniref:DUF7823 domain-containing protein n=1 Tax=Xenorhabdus sp. KK7.4 TaxID=1851572 RepID=UPI000C042345|nr:hypothetical protein [Xenorhabdus sp. KK7.4]PHM51419.1 hypothetical protein Xekk_03727 [Xenorhabdus sp. KK7.4]